MIPTYGYGRGDNGAVACFGYSKTAAIIQALGRATQIFRVAFYRAFAYEVYKA
jgi:hypothetical protein